MLALLAWGVYGVLLFGRLKLGWRDFASAPLLGLFYGAFAAVVAPESPDVRLPFV